MAAVFTGNGLGLFDASMAQQRGMGGTGASGRDRHYVNVATGNLLLQSQDEQLLFRGMSVGQLRTYNSLGLPSDVGQDGWITGFERRVELLSGELNVAGSVMRRHTGDGAHQDYVYVAPGLYQSTAGAGAHDRLVWDATSLTWTSIEGSSRREDHYADHADQTLRGRLTGIVDTRSDGITPVTWSVAYDASGRITSVSAEDGTGHGDAFVYAYDSDGRLARLSTRENGVLRGQVDYGYDTQGRLTTVLVDLTPDDGVGDSDLWNESEPASNDGRLLRTTYTYTDATSLRIAEARYSDGSVSSYSYDVQGRVRTVTRGDTNANDADGAGRTVTYDYDSANRRTNVSDSTGRTWSYAHDADGRLTRIESPAVDGQRDVTVYSYDTQGNALHVSTSRGSQVLSRTDFQYDTQGNVTWQWDRVDASGSARAVQRTYSGTHQVLSETVYTGLDPDGAAPAQGPTGGLTSRFVYDAQDRLRFTVNAAGEVREIEYAAAGNGIGQAIATRQYLGITYAGGYSLAELTAWATTGRKAQSTLAESSYDLQGRLSRTQAYARVDASGNGILDDAAEIVEYVHDAQGLLRQKVVLRSSTATANDGRDIRQGVAYTYDGMGRLLAEVVTEQVGAADARVLSNTTWVHLDAQGALRTTIEGGSSVGDGITANDLLRVEVRNAAGQVVAMTESAVSGGSAQTTEYVYDSAGQLRAVKDAGGGVTYRFYNETGDLAALVDPTGALVEYVHDANGQVVETRAYATRLDTAGWLSGQGVAKQRVDEIRPVWSSDFSILPVEGLDSSRVDNPNYANAVRHEDGRLVFQTSERETQTNPHLPLDRVHGVMGDVAYRAEVSTDAAMDSSYLLFGLQNTASGDAFRRFGAWFSNGKLLTYVNKNGSSSHTAIGTLQPSTTYVLEARVHDGKVQYQVYVKGQDPANGFSFEGDASDWGDARLTLYGKAGPGLDGDPLFLDNLSVTDTGTRESSRTYDDAGRLVRETDAEGGITTYQYDGAGRLLRQQMTDAAGTAATARTTRYFHDAAGRQVGRLDAAGFLTEYRYDTAGRLITTLAYATATPTAHRAQGAMEQLRPVSNQADQLSRFFHDGRGNVIAELDAEGFLTEYVVDEANHQRAERRHGTALTGLAGDESLASLRLHVQGGQVREKRRSFDARGLLVSEVNPEGTVNRYTYDSQGRLLRTEAAQATTEQRDGYRRYDVFGNLVGELSGEGGVRVVPGMSEAQLDAVYAQYGVRHAYDALGRRIESIDSHGSKSWYFYDAAGRQTHVVRGVANAQGVPNAEGEVTETRYTAFGEVRETIAYTGRLAIGSPFGRDQVAAAVQVLQYVAAADSRTRFTYDRLGQLQLRTDALGHQSSWDFNAFGEVVRETRQIDGASSAVITSRFDQRGLRTSRTEDPNGADRTRTWTYDAFGRAVTATDGRGGAINLAYDRLGRQVSQQQSVSGRSEVSRITYDAWSRVTETTDARGGVTRFHYDDAARSVVMTTPEGVTHTVFHNRHGQEVGRTDGAGHTSHLAYNRDGQLTESETADGGTFSNVYDARGLLTRTVDASGRAVGYQYDAAGRLTARIEDPEGLALTTRYAYDGQGRRISLTDAGGVRTSFAYDLEGRLLERIEDPNGLDLTTRYTWDARGLQLSVTQGAGTTAATTTSYAYDALGRRTSETMDAGSGRLNLTTRYVYDGNDNVVARVDAEDRITRYAYDEANRLILAVDGAGGVVRHWYDAAGRVVATRSYAQAITTDALGETPSSATILGLLTTNNARDIQQFTVYDADGRARVVVDGAGAVTAFAYDGAGHQAQVHRYADTAALTSTLRSRLQAGTATVTEMLAGVSPDPSRDARQYTVRDAVGRPRFVIGTDGSVVEYRYDLAGRAAQTRAYPVPLTLSAADRTALESGLMEADTVAGRLTTQNTSARVTYTVYDAAGRERFVAERMDANHALVTEYTRDAMGRTIAATRYGEPVAFSPGQSEDALESALQGVTDARTTRYIHDAAGRQRFVVDASGAVSEQRYDATGRITEERTYGQRPPGGVSLSDWSQTQPASSVRVTRNLYDGAGRLLTRTDALNHTERYAYDGAGLVVRYTDRNAAVWDYGYNAAGRRTSETSPQVSVATASATGSVATSSRRLVTRIAYDALGNVVQRTEDANGTAPRVTEYAYDNRGHQIRTTFPDAWKIDEATGELVQTGQRPTIEIDYDSFGRATVQRDVRDQYSYKVYDALGRLAYEVDPDGFVSGYTYNAFGEQVTLRRYATALDTSNVAGWVEGQALTEAVVESAGVLTSGSADRSLTRTYDLRGHVVSVTQGQVTYYRADGGTATGSPVTRFEYDAYGQTVRESTLLEGNPDQADARWAHTLSYYDALGRNTFTVDAEGFATTTRYNATGEVVEQVQHARALDTDAVSVGTAPAAPAMGDAVTGFDRISRWQRDALGRAVVETQVRRYQNGDGSAGVRDVETAMEYDAEGRVTSLTTDAGTTTTKYDALGRVTSVREPERLVLTASAQNSLLGSTTLDLASAGLYAEVSPYMSMAYDAFGNLVHSRRYANGVAAGANSPVADSARDRIEVTRYDHQGRAVMTRNAEGHLVYSAYDAADHLVKQWHRLSGSVSGRDALVTTTYTYTDGGRQASTRQTRTLVSTGAVHTERHETVRYNAFGEIIEKTHVGLDGVLAYSYDRAGRLTGSNESGAARQYGYNLAGHQVRESRRAYLNPSQSVDAVTTMRTDRLGRAVSTTLPSHSASTSATTVVSQRFDRWGNVLEVIDGRGYRTNYQYNQFDQITRDERPLVEVVSEDGESEWLRPVNQWFYDAAGRLVGTRDANGNLRTNGYDNAGQLTESRDAYGNATLFAYDALGNQRMSQNPLGYLTFKDYDRQGRITAIGDYLPNAADTQRARTVLQAYQLNENGDRLRVTNALNYSALYDFDARGNVIRSQTATGVVNDFGYDGLGRKNFEGNALSGGTYTDRDGDVRRRDEQTWQYDSYGRVLDHNNLGGRDYNYAYDTASGQQVSETGYGGPAGVGASNKSIRYYANGSLREISEGSGTPLYRYEYDAAGNRTLEETRYTDGSGQLVHTVTRSVYDSHNRVQRVVQDDLSTGTSKRVFDLTYTYDAVGNRRSVRAVSGYGPDVEAVPITNSAPNVVGPPDDRVVRKGRTSEFTLLFSDIFRDAEQDALTLLIDRADGSALPSWLTATRDAQTGEIRFVATPPAGTADQDIEVRLTARETNAPTRQGITTFTVKVRTNTAPTLVPSAPGTLHAKTSQPWLHELVATDFFRDADVGDVLSLAVDNPGALPSWLHVDTQNPAVVRLSGTPLATSSFTLKLRATDEHGATITKSIVITTAPNRAPTGTAPPAQEAIIGRDFEWSSALSDIFSDADGDPLDITASGLPAWMSFQHLTARAEPELRLAGHVPVGLPDQTAYTIRLTATDVDGATKTISFQVKAQVNRAPVATSWIAPDLRVNDAYDVTVPIDTLFVDQEGDQVFVEPAGNEPSWLTVSVNSVARTIRFHGKPTSNGQAGSFAFQLHGRDAEGLTSTANVSIKVGTDTAPVRQSAVGVADRVLDIGRPFSFTLPSGMFTDADGDGLSLIAQSLRRERLDTIPGQWTNLIVPEALPSWLHFNSSTRTFSGTVPANAPDDLVVRVRANDGRNLSAFDQEAIGGEHFAGDGDIHISFKPYDNPPPMYEGGLPNRSSNEGQAVSWALPSGAFSDPDGEALSYSIMVERPAHYAIVWDPRDNAYVPQEVPAEWQQAYTLSINTATGKITGTPPVFMTPISPTGHPAPREMASYRVKIIARDGANKTAEGIFNVDVNLPPKAVSETLNIGTNVTFSRPLTGFGDPEGKALTYTATLQGGGALPSWMQFSSTGTLSGTSPVAGGTWVLTVTATDPNGLTVTSDVTVRVANEPPRYHEGTIPSLLTGNATVAFDFTVPAGAFSDPNGDSLTYSAKLATYEPPYTDWEGVTFPGRWAYSDLPSWLNFNTASGRLTGTPPNVGGFYIAFAAHDGSAMSERRLVTLSVGQAPNYAPVAPNLPTQSAGRNQFWSYQVPAFGDVNGDTLTYQAGPLPAGITFSAATRTFSGTLASLGSHTLTITANDGRGGVASGSFQLNVVNKAPIAPTIPDRTATAGTSWSYLVPAFSDPNGDALTYSVSGLPSWMSFNAQTRTLSGTPGPVGSWSITVTARDGSNAEATRSFTVSTSNSAPTVAQPVANRSVARNVTWSYQVPIGTFADDNGDALTFSASNLPAGISFNASTRTFSGKATVLGAHTISVTASDGRGGTVTDSFVLTVVNTAPIYEGGLPSRVPQEGESVSWAMPAGTFTDPNADALSYSIMVERPAYREWYWDAADATYLTRLVPAQWQNVSGLVINSVTGKITGTPPLFSTPVHPVNGGTSYVQPDYRVKIIAEDAAGASAEGVFNVSVNMRPDASYVGNRTIKSSMPWSYQIPAFSDPNGDAVTHTASGLPSGLAFNSSTRTISGEVATPGTYTITITGNDGRGGVSSTSFTLTVQANTKPTAPTIGTQTATVGSAWSLQLPAFTDPNGDAMAYTATSLPPGLSFNASSRVISGTPSTAGSYTVRYSADDGRGGVTTKTFTITVNAAPVPNRAPVVNRTPPSPAQHFYTTTQWVVQPTSFTLPADTFVDPDGNPMTYQIITKPSWLTYSYVAGSGHRFTGVNSDTSRYAYHTITIRAKDNKGLYKDVSFTVTSEYYNHLGGGGPGGPTQPLSMPMAKPMSFDMASVGMTDSAETELQSTALMPEDGMTGTDAMIGQVGMAQMASTSHPYQVTEYWYTYDKENRVRIQNGVMEAGRIVVGVGYQGDSYEAMYDAAGHEVARLVRFPSAAQGGSPRDFVYRVAYDLRGNKTMEFHVQALGDSTSDGIERQFGYDAANQLKWSRSYYEADSQLTFYHSREAANFVIRYGGWLSAAEDYTYDQDGRLLTHNTHRRGEMDGELLWERFVNGTGPNQRTDISVLDAVTRIDHTGGYDTAGRAVTYRYSAAAIGWANHTYTTTYQGWGTYQEKTVAGTSTNSNYKATTNTLTYDVMGRLYSQREHTPLSNGEMDDRMRYYAHNGDGAVQMRRDGVMTDGQFVQAPGPYGNKANTLFVHAGGQQQAQLQEGGSIRMNNGGTAYAKQLQGLNGIGGYAAGGGKVTVQAGETLSTLAQRVYGNASLWYVLADANGLGDPEQALAAGTQLNAPNVEVSKNDAGTFKPYNPNEAIGSTTPSLPYIAPPPEQSCNAVATILMVVVAVAVTYFTAGAAATYFAPAGSAAVSGGAVLTGASASSIGLGATIGGAAVGGAAGSVASQAVGSAMGVTSFSWRSALVSGAVTGATAGFGGALQAGKLGATLSRVLSSSDYGRAAATAVAGQLTSYGASRALGMEASFSWAAVAASAISAAATTRIGGVPLTEGGSSTGNLVNDFGGGLLRGAIDGTTRRLMGMGRQDWGQLAADAFGNALGNATVRGIQGWQANRTDTSRRELMQNWAAEDEQQRQQMITDEDFARASQDLADAEARVAALDAEEASLLGGSATGGYWDENGGLEIDIIGGRLAKDGENDLDGALLGLRAWMGGVREDVRSIVDNADNPFMAGLGSGLYAINSVTDAVVGGFVDTGRLLTSSEQRSQFVGGMTNLLTTNPLTTANKAWEAWSNLSAEDRLRYGAATIASLGAAPLSRGKAFAELDGLVPTAIRTKPEFSGDWSNYKTLGIGDSPLASPEGIRLVNELEPLTYSRQEAILQAEDLMASGSTLPYANPIQVGDVFYKLTPEGTLGGAKSPFWFTESQIAPLRDLTYDQIADRLGLPLASQQGSSFSLVSIRATAPGTSFTSRIAPTTEIGAGGTLWQQSGGAYQTLLINRLLFTAPQVVKRTFP